MVAQPLHGYPAARAPYMCAYTVEDPHVDDMLPGDLLIIDTERPIGPTDVVAYIADDLVSAAGATVEIAAGMPVLGVVVSWQREIPTPYRERRVEVRYPDA